MKGKSMKNKIKLIIFLIPLIILSSGCSATYNINITDETIEEELAISEDIDQANKNSYIYKYGTYDENDMCFDCLSKYINSMQDEYVNNYYINKDNFERDNKIYNYNTYQGVYSYNLTNKKEYSLKNNSLINNLIKDSLIINDENIIMHLDNIPSSMIEKLDKVSIIVTTELPVISNNADNTSDNTYTWNYDKTNNLNKSLSLYIEKPKVEDNTKNDNTKNNNDNKENSPAFVLIIMIGIYLAIIIAVINIFNKKKKLF